MGSKINRYLVLKYSFCTPRQSMLKTISLLFLNHCNKQTKNFLLELSSEIFSLLFLFTVHTLFCVRNINNSLIETHNTWSTQIEQDRQIPQYQEYLDRIGRVYTSILGVPRQNRTGKYLNTRSILIEQGGQIYLNTWSTLIEQDRQIPQYQEYLDRIGQVDTSILGVP